MKVIVNRNQYEKVINEGRGHSKSVEKWGDYITDELLPMVLKQDVGEDTYSLKKLSLKLKERDFYKDIPIESILLTVIINDSEDDCDFIIKAELVHTGSTAGFFGATPVVQQAHIVDADGTLADITAKFNTLLAQLEALGLLVDV